MKRCPVCQRTYADDTLAYCLEDGSALVSGASGASDLPATVIMPDPRITAPVNQETYRPGIQPQSYTPPTPSWQHAPPPQISQSRALRPGRGAAVTSLIFAIVAFVLLGFCIVAGANGVDERLIGGIFLLSALLALTGAILGIVAASRSSKDTNVQNARVLSIIALVLNGLYLIITIIFLILGAVASSR